MNTEDLRKASMAVFLVLDKKVAYDLSEKLRWAADEIDRLRIQISQQSVAPV